MLNRTAWAVTLLLMGAIAGCESQNAAPSTDLIPPPEVTDAVFYDNHNHENVFITGVYFKLQSDYRMDVIASLNGRNWAPARKIMESSSTNYKVTLPYGAEYPQVWVRVYGMNGQFSPPFLVHN
jgi:hypothetical protein